MDEIPVTVTDVTDDPDASVETELKAPEKKHLEVPNFNPVENLLEKLENWLIMQPEWAIVLSMPRPARRKAINAMSKRFLTIPNRRGFV